MAASSLIGLIALLALLGATSADTRSSAFSFLRFERDPAAIALLGGSKVVGGGVPAIELSGQAVFEEPVRVVQGNPRSLASFSTNFTFSLSAGSSKGDGFAFAMAPVGFISNLSGDGRFGLPLGKNRTLDGLLAVEFDAYKNRVAISSGNSVKVGNVSSLKLVMNSGKKALLCWIDYQAGSRRLEVRLSDLGGSRAVDPFIAHRVDLWKMWMDRDVYLGLSSSTRSCLIHSWSFELRRVPHWIHSLPLDPNAVSKEEEAKPLIPASGEKSDCFLKVLAALIFGVAGGSLGTFCILYLCTIFGRRRPVAPEELAGKVQPVDCEYKKVEVVVLDKAIEDEH
ncbi:hypothetical protein SAY86_014849 [Trapa natans]|uniref:Legume lectin domain-containing protein n=1 Tax=Trapa natans TaxID=22666 RepID=A0AAN7KL02_TRANT|nr:hypothetical protein SAY86_014849 [Trapa natans]